MMRVLVGALTVRAERLHRSEKAKVPRGLAKRTQTQMSYDHWPDGRSHQGDDRMWGRWFFYTLINCPVVLLLAVLLLYATGLMPPTDQNWEQTELVAIGAFIWFVFSFVLQLSGWWTPIVEGVRRLEANPVNFTEELFSLLFKLVLVLAAVLSIILLVTGCWRLTRSIRVTDPEAAIVDHGDISQVRSP